jgi:alpha-galactosidase
MMTPDSPADAELTGDGAELRLDGRIFARLKRGYVVADRDGLAHDWTLVRIGSGGVWEIRLELRNASDAPVTVTRMDSCALDLDLGPDPTHWRTNWYRSAWGDEFRPRHGTTRHDLFLDVRSGRSSHGSAPWLGIEREDDRAAVIICPAWSGNWHITALSGGSVTAGISPWRFSVTIRPGERVTAPSVVIAAATNLDAAAVELQRAVRDHWLARSPFADTVPTEWNHWWPYEDVEVTEEVISRNAVTTAEVGLEVATVDAGWFGASDAASDWQEQRGDWTDVNTERFPSGLTALGDAIRAAGALPGIWIEAEAVGRSARVRAEHPDLLAAADGNTQPDPSYRRMTVSLDPADPGFLGYVCLGSPAGRAQLRSSLGDLIERVGARWIKLDFNVDPDAGCTRTDHGHGAGDGLFRHYEGLYRVLDEVRGKYPDVFLEACSSGGLRIDLGLARHVHAFFLSDPDYTEHHLEVLHGASRMLPPLGILHWSQSQWRGDYPPQQRDWARVQPEEFRTMLRAAMLHRFGVSLRLTDLAPALLDVLGEHVRLFRTEVAPLVRDGVLRPLSPTPERGGLGERAPAFQLSSDREDRHVAAAFVLSGGRPLTRLRLRALDPDTSYRVTDLATGEMSSADGRTLVDVGVALSTAGAPTSWLLAVVPAS